MKQKRIWNKIAKEWHEYKQKPSKDTIDFLKKTSGRILDLGSGSGRNLYKTRGTIYLLDFSRKMLKLGEKRAKERRIKAKFKKANLWKIPYKDEFFDYAICISALHCVKGEKKREKSVKELYRVLKKHGKARIGVWNIKSKRFKNSKKEKLINWTDKGKRYYYLYDEKEVHNLFKSVGFKIISTSNSEMMINFVVQK